MAQSSQNVLVQNIEKIVLVVALAILGICVLTTMTGGEPAVKVGNRTVQASQVNDTLLEEMNVALGRIQPPEPIPPVKDWVEVARAALLVSEDISPALAITPVRPVVKEPSGLKDDTKRTFGLDEVAAKMPLPEKPHVTGSPELRRTGDQENPVKDQLVLHVLSSFPAHELNTLWNSEEMFRNYMQPFPARFAKVEVQVQELAEDGTWGEPRDVTGAVMTVSDRGPSPQATPVVPDWDGVVGSPSDLMIARITSPQGELAMGGEERIAQPAYWELLNNKRTFRPWTIRIPAWMAESVWTAANVPASARPVTATPTSPSMYSPPGGGYPGPADYYMPPGMQHPMHPSMHPSMVPTAATPARAPTVVVNEEKEELPPPLPQFSVQRVAKMMVWVHDEEVGYDKVYRYRVRVSVVNPLLRNPRLVKEDDKVSARQALVFSSQLAPGNTEDEDRGWSEWSDRVIVPRQVESFLVGGSRGNNTVTMRVFARGLGQRVESSFPVGVGEKIGSEQSRDVMNPLTRKVEKQEVDFSTGLTLVAIDWGKRLATTDGRGTLQITLMDDQGRLHTRILQADETNPRRMFLVEEVKRQEPVKVTAPTETRPQQPRQPVRRPTTNTPPRN